MFAYITKEEFKKIVKETGTDPATLAQSLIEKNHTLEGYVRRGPKGDNYVLTENDIKSIARLAYLKIDLNELAALAASKVNVPVVEKIIEKKEIVKEIPIVRETIKETIREPDITGDEIIDKIYESGKKIDASKIANLPPAQRIIERVGGFVETPLKSGSNISIARDNFGALVISSTASGSGISVETPTGTVDGSNTTFTVLNEPRFVIIDGMFRVSGFGYTYLAGTIEVDSAAPPVQFIRSYY